MFAAINSYIHAPVITINGTNYTVEFFCVQIIRYVPCSVVIQLLAVIYNYALTAIVVDDGTKGSNS